MMQFIDWWQLEPADLTGCGVLADVSAHDAPASARRAVARLFVIHAIAGAVGNRQEIVVSGLAAASYVAALLAADDVEYGPLCACLVALQREDWHALAASLHEAARVCAARRASCAARSLAELGYEAALEIGDWQDAYFSARTLERLALLDECPGAEERWGRRAALQLSRVQRGSRAL